MSNILDTVKNATAHDTVRKMASVTQPQARLMAAAAHTPGGYGGVPQSVGQDFNRADKGSAMLKAAMANRASRGAAQKKLRSDGDTPAQERAESPAVKAAEARRGIK